MTTRQATCAERVETELQDRLADLRKLLALYLEDPDAYDNDRSARRSCSSVSTR